MTELSRFTDVISNYEIDKLLSIGGGESVYEISTKLLQAPFELSLYSDCDDALKSKLKNFAKAAKLMQHRGIATFYEAHEIQSSFCFVYQRVEGPSLNEALTGKTISKELAVEIFVQVLSTVKYLHDHEVFHLPLSLDRFRTDEEGDAKLVISFRPHGEPEARYKAPETDKKESCFENVRALGVMLRLLLHAADPYQFTIEQEFFEGDFSLPFHLKEYEPLLKSMLDTERNTKVVDILQNELVKAANSRRHEKVLNRLKLGGKGLETQNKPNASSFDAMFEEKCRKQLLEQKPFYKSKSSKANATSNNEEDKFVLRIPYQLKRTEEFVNKFLLEREIVHTVGDKKNVWVCYHFDAETEIVTSFKILFREVTRSLYCNLNFIFLKGTDYVYDRFIEEIYSKVDFFN